MTRGTGPVPRAKDSHARREAPPPREDRPRRPHPVDAEAWVTFRVTWGARQGADARRLLAAVCRRGNIRGADVGSIRVEDAMSFVDVAPGVADAFEKEASRRDPRDPHVRISREGTQGSPRERPQGPRERPHRPPHGGGHDGQSPLRRPPRRP